ncbi:hypothetical protein [Streptomyces laurentii]|uniref:hypothetical protein n=1 Tax=Streptomyces laurentii TaxID=39478 RepID=UPI003679A26B
MIPPLARRHGLRHRQPADVADLAEEADHVTALIAGSIAFSGTAGAFLDHAPEGVPEARRAEAAYTALTGGVGAV